MEYQEKNIIKQREISLLSKQKSIYDNYVYIDRERYEFEEQDIISPLVRMMFPASFIDLPEALAKQMYPSDYRPTVIKTNLSLTVHFAFTYFKETIKMNEVATCARYYLEVIKRLYPGNQLLGNSEFFIDKDRTRVLGWYSFANPTMDGTNYNIHAFTEVDGKLFFGVFLSTQEKRFEAWKPFAFEVLSSVTSGREKGGWSV